MDIIFFCHINEFYVPNRISYKIQNFDHQNLIYGYDDDSQTFLVSGYASSKQYEQSVMSYVDFKESIKNVSDFNFASGCYKPKGNIPGFDQGMLLTELRDYYNSSSQNPNVNYGLKFYDSLCTYLEDDGNEIDLRCVYLLNEHKKLMCLKIKYLLEMHLLSEPQFLREYEGVYELTSKIHNLSLKRNITGNLSLTYKIVENIKYVIQKEKAVLPDLICAIDRGC